MPDILTSDQWLSRLRQARAEIPGRYLAMYSTWWGGIVTDPSLMLVPFDDHLVHRGDGIFEAFRVVEGALFDLHAHLDRLENSALRIGLALPQSRTQIVETCVQTARAAKSDVAAVRLFVGRGPGSFSPNPYESAKSQLYVVVTDFRPVSPENYERGVKAVVSKIPQKDPFFARIKSCNYLPNVLMKKEAVDAGVMFSLGCDPKGILMEGPTENLVLLTAEGVLKVPRFDYTLRGTTLLTVIDELERNPNRDLVKSIEFVDVRVDELWAAAEVMMIGTTLEVLPVVEVEGRKIGDGQPGPVARELRRRLRHEMANNSKRRVPLD